MENKVKAFQVFYPMQNEFEVVRGALLRYLCMEYAMGRIPSIPSESLVTALVFYLIHGYDSDTKERIRRYCNHKNMQSVDQINLKLKQAGYLIDSKMSKKNKSLNPALQNLSQYLHNHKNGKIIMMDVIYVDHGRREEV